MESSLPMMAPIFTAVLTLLWEHGEHGDDLLLSNGDPPMVVDGGGGMVVVAP